MNEFEQLIKYLLDKTFYLILFFVFLSIINLSHLISAYKNIKLFITDILKKEESNNFIFAGEVTTYENKLLSRKFDVVKINATTHTLGIGSEYEWIKKYYHDAKLISQALKEMEISSGEIIYFDIQTIQFGETQKKIYFDISSFLNENGSTSSGDTFINDKIKKLYK